MYLVIKQPLNIFNKEFMKTLMTSKTLFKYSLVQSNSYTDLAIVFMNTDVLRHSKKCNFAQNIVKLNIQYSKMIIRNSNYNYIKQHF